MNLEVHIDWMNGTFLVGRLHPSDQGNAVTFEYSADWLKRDNAFAIDPTSLPLQPGPHHSAGLFGAIHDCGPDRWGRILIERAVRKKILAKKPYRDIDYVLALDDSTRLGALRFRLEPGEVFLAATSGALPPLVRLNELLHAADAIHGEQETEKDLRFLLGAGSPLGGARPKAAVSLADSRLAIAKFPKPDDTRDIAAGEILALTLASQAGIRTAEHQLVSVGPRKVSVITRFDRLEGRRVPFISAATLLGLPQGESGAYTQLADGIRRFGDDVAGDLKELWRRLVFSLLASNFDDHLHNHGFLMLRDGRWSLSPAYDLNPVPEIDRVLVGKTSISEDQEQPSMDAALAAAARFGLKPTEARATLGEVFESVSRWRAVGRKLNIAAVTLDAYASAFEQPLMDETKHLLGN
jgi:serine/threonine-protein kinase HipA